MEQTQVKLLTEEVPHTYDGKEVSYGISETDVEDLMLLENSQMWKTYRKYLMGQKTARLAHAFSLDDPTKMAKEMGVIVGLNIAINQIAFSCSQIRQARERAVKRQDEGKGKKQN